MRRLVRNTRIKNFTSREHALWARLLGGVGEDDSERNLEASTREWDELRDFVAYRASAVAANARRAVASVPHARVAESDPSAAVDGWGVVGWGMGLGDIVGCGVVG